MVTSGHHRHQQKDKHEDRGRRQRRGRKVPRNPFKPRRARLLGEPRASGARPRFRAKNTGAEDPEHQAPLQVGDLCQSTGVEHAPELTRSCLPNKETGQYPKKNTCYVLGRVLWEREKTPATGAIWNTTSEELFLVGIPGLTLGTRVAFLMFDFAPRRPGNVLSNPSSA